jgi:competence protein ComEC
MNRSNFTALIFFLLAVLDVFLWCEMAGANTPRPGDYFLDVGQGDSELVILPGDVRILIDGGPANDKAAAALGKILPAGDRYIDLVMNSHPQLDHFGGLAAVLDGFKVGAFLWNGRSDSPNVAEWRTLVQKAGDDHIAMVPLAQDDTIRAGASDLRILSPDAELGQSAELNDTGLVALAETPDLRTLFTADIAFNVENYLLKRGAADLRADVLKIAHHGSKYSSGADFLRAVSPKAVAIEVGAGNTYGHPSPQTLARIASSTNAQVFRTDQDGTVEIFEEDGRLKVITEK